MKAQFKKKLTVENKKANGGSKAVTKVNGKPETNGKRKFSQISPQMNEEIQSDSEAEQEKLANLELFLK